ncbi:MAG: NTP transferase domain-containing protein, partial [Eubacteriales bacterium]|nr:NTP transferase domain-containing protein [Eubacteriales bacterium]
MRYSAVIAAAGLSSRMKSFKPLMPLAGDTVIGNVIDTLKQAGAEDIVVVIGHRADEMTKYLEKLEVRIYENKRYLETEMLDSVKLGLEALGENYDAVFITPGDMPLIKLESLESLKRIKAGVARPVCQGKGGHPVLLDKKHVGSLLAYSGDSGLKGALKSLDEPMIDLEVDDLGVIMNLNTPEDFERARLYEQKNQSKKMSASVPTDEEIAELWDRFGTPARVRQHSMAVEAAAAELTAELETAGVELDKILIRAAALLHDLCRTERQHDKVAGSCLREQGYYRVAEIIERHHDGSWEADLDEAGVLYLADKIIMGTARVSVEERFEFSYKKC